MDICPCYSVENKKASQSEKKGTSYLKFLKNLDQVIIFWTISAGWRGLFIESGLRGEYAELCMWSVCILTLITKLNIKEFMMQNQYIHRIEAVHSWKVEMLNNFSFKIKSTYLKLAVD